MSQFDDLFISKKVLAQWINGLTTTLRKLVFFSINGPHLDGIHLDGHTKGI